MRYLFFLLLVASCLGKSAAEQGLAARPSPHTVKVYRDSGARQCRPVGISLQAMANVLEQHGIHVISASCATDGRMRVALCDSDAGLLYVYEIPKANLGKAARLGYKAVTKLHGYAERQCPRVTPNRS